MSRISDILVHMRDSLSDEDKSRWTDDRLIRLLDDAQKDVVTEAKLLRSKANLHIQADKAVYPLPSDALLITRVVNSDGEPIDFFTHEEMDTKASNGAVPYAWESQTGETIASIIFDKQDPGFVKVYPIPTGDDTVGDTYTTSDYGVVVESENDIVVGDFGIVASVSETATDTTSTNSNFGAIVDMIGIEATLQVYYIRTPATLSNIEDIPEVRDIWDKALRYYALAMAYTDDQDTQNLAVATKFFGMYDRELKKISKTSSKNSTNSTKSRGATYNKAI